MIILKFLFSLFFWVYIQLGILLVLILSLPANLLPNRGRAFNYALAKLLLRLLFFISFFRIRLKSGQKVGLVNREILIANKPDLLSTFALIISLPRQVRFVAAENIFYIPFFGWLLKAIGCIPAGKKLGGPLGFAVSVMAAMKQNEAVLFYPRNLRRFNGRVSEFKPGEISVARSAGATLLPLVVTGTKKLIKRGSVLLWPGAIEITVHEPVTPAELGSVDTVMARLTRLYQGELPFEGD
ncbi:MAG: 1-acyl-sn-glycerol-3-phosphate acyltransferase [Candidatus Saganbacteria bacterium]|nr:1-acyl-sn-glycerol-3-phosphate acyltransferase [Candidatus Saganbacteria bacterium]